MKIICEHISKDFISRNAVLSVLKDINVEIEEHDFVCILGLNGCGKTTLLKILAGILKPSKGRIYYAGDNNNFRPTSMIFQEQGLFPWLNVIDNVCFILEMRGLPKKERYRKVEGYIEKMGLTKFIDYYPHQLSTGMKQKIGLIRGMSIDSEVILIDEAEPHLDTYSKLIIQEDIYKVWNEYKKTIIYVTHDIEAALYLAKHIWIMGKSPANIIKEFDMIPYKSRIGQREYADVQIFDLKKQIIDIIQKEAHKHYNGI